MSVFDGILARLGYTKARATQSAPQPSTPGWLQATGAGQQYSIPGLRMADAQEEMYQRLSWIYSAIAHPARMAAAAALNVKRRQGEKLVDIPNHPFELLLQRPNPLDSRFELMEKTFSFRRLTGTAYWWLNRAGPGEPPAEIWVIPSHQIKPVPDGRMFLRGYLYEPGNGEKPVPLEPWEVGQFREFHPRNWFVGMSAMEALATVAIGDMKMQEWNTNYFGKDNAKMPGALAFADPIAEPIWKQMQADIRDQWGGTNRMGPLLLRNVGKGGVEWVAMSLSQKDMEFLAGRTFTKEEIYATLAPGLASVLATNATEANARVGKATLMEMAVWPMLTSMAEKITNDVLTSYGGDLVAEFEDVRITDRAMALDEQRAYASVHTVDEIRSEFYDDKPLGDERGKLLPAQIGPGTKLPGDEPEPESTPPQLLPFQQGAQGGQDDGGQTDDAAQQEQQTDDANGEAADTEAVKAARLGDLIRWRRKATKRGKACDFESDALWLGMRAAIKTAQERAGLRAWRFLKAMPDARDEAEAEMTAVVNEVFGEHSQATAQAIAAGQAPDYGALQEDLKKKLEPELVAIATDEVLREANDIGVEFDVAEVYTLALEWAREYTYELVSGLIETTRKVVSEAITRYLETPGMTQAELEALLAPAFGEIRAGMIAITEVTRAYAMAVLLYQRLLAAKGIKLLRVWRTAKDERVCPLCGPLDGLTELEWGDDMDGPPAHVRCRCWLTLELAR